MHSPNESDETSGDDESENDSQMMEAENNDDDDPPAAGAMMVEVENKSELAISVAPTAEPAHRANPNKTVTA